MHSSSSLEVQEKLETDHLKANFFLRPNQSLDLTLSVVQQKQAIHGIILWLRNNLQQMSSIGKNLIVRHDWKSGEYKCAAGRTSVRLDFQGKTLGDSGECRFYIQQDEVRGKTNLAQIHLTNELNSLIQLTEGHIPTKKSEYKKHKEIKSIKKVEKMNHSDIFRSGGHQQACSQNKQEKNEEKQIATAQIIAETVKLLQSFDDYCDNHIIKKGVHSPGARISMKEHNRKSNR